ncbi:MAG TPA: YybS family protein [Bacillota bacterium]
MNQSKKVTDGALLTGIYIILLLIQFFVPFLSMFVMFLMPVPFIMYAYKHGWKPSVFVFIAALILSALLMTVISIPFTVLAGLGGIIIGTSLNRNVSAYESWARGTIGFVIGLLFFFLFGQIVFQVNVVEQFNEVIQESFEMSTKMLNQAGFLNESDIQEEMEQQISMLKNLLPVWLVMTSIILAFVSQWMSYKIINRMDHQKLRFPPFHQLKFPILVFWIYFIAFFLLFIDMDQDGMLFIAVQNFHMLAGILLIIQGFSFIFYFSHHKHESKTLPVVSIILSVVLAPLVLPLVRIIGIIDMATSLRERLAKG